LAAHSDLTSGVTPGQKLTESPRIFRSNRRRNGVLAVVHFQLRAKQKRPQEVKPEWYGNGIARPVTIKKMSAEDTQ
jgi:hypothetical protein